MGTSGYKIEEDDFALDVQDYYIELLYDGLSDDEASARIIEEFAPDSSDIDERYVFWIALSSIQYQYGRLQDDVQKKSLEIIDSGEDLERWDELKDKRQAELLKLKEKLLSPLPKTKKLIKRMPKLNEGDIFKFRINDKVTRYGRVIKEGFLVFYGMGMLRCGVKPQLEDIVKFDIKLVIGSTCYVFLTKKYKVIGNLPLEEKFKQPVYFYHRSAYQDICEIFNIWEASVYTKKHINEIHPQIEQWSSYSHYHILKRLGY